MNKQILYDILPHYPTILEIGAHHGEDTIHFCFMFPDGRIHIIEPDPRCISIIKALRLNVHLFEGVLSDVNMPDMEFFPSYGSVGSADWDGSGSIMAPAGHLTTFPQVVFHDPIHVTSMTLHTYMLYYKIDLIDFIWADVQGAEERIILGGLDEFRSKVRYFYTEYCQKELYLGCPTRERILALLPNYSIMLDTGGDVVGDMLLKNMELS